MVFWACLQVDSIKIDTATVGAIVSSITPVRIEHGNDFKDEFFA